MRRNPTTYAVVKPPLAQTGTIDVELAGNAAANAGPGARRVRAGGFPNTREHFDTSISDRQMGGRTTRCGRNHRPSNAAQPGFDFDRLRKESPEKYESYVDLELVCGRSIGFVWTDEGAVDRPQRSATLLIINDMKFGDVGGAVALWVGPGTEGYLRESKDFA